MPYNSKQYDAAFPFLRGGDDNIVDVNDKKRVQAYDLYENIWINSIETLKLVLRGSDSVPLLMPSGRKIIEATNRYLAVNFDYLVEATGDEASRQLVDTWFGEFFKRERCRAKFGSNRRWALVRGDAIFYVHADPNKASGERISLTELDPRQVFYIEDGNSRLTGVYIVDTIHDPRDTGGDASKVLARRRSFRKTLDGNNQFTGEVTSDLTHWTVGKWDDRNLAAKDLERVSLANLDEDPEPLNAPISQLPIYHWRNSPMQNTDWGNSQLAGFETLLYALNQSLTDEDATIVFQGLGMYVTNAAPPVDPNTGEITDWNIGPMQIIEIGSEQEFQRVTGITDVSPYQDHMSWIDEKGISEGSGVPEVAIGRVDVTVAESGIALTLQFAPLIAQNAEKEEEILVVMDQMLHDITTMWLPAYEPETFPNAASVATVSTVSVVDDPMPKNRDAEIQETLLLRTSNLILATMAIAKLRKLGWEFPQFDTDGVTPLTDDDLAAMLHAQADADASVGLGALGAGDGTTGQVDENGNPIDDTGQTPPDQTTIPLGVT